MAERKIIHIEPGSEIEQILRLGRDSSVSLESEGSVFLIQRQKQDPFANYDPQDARAALNEAAGALSGIDIETFKREIRGQRDQDSSGCPG